MSLIHMRTHLNELLSYENAAVIARYEQDYPQSRLTSYEAMTELMKYIWLCRQHKADKHLRPDDETLHFTCFMHAEMKDIDNMWHTFLLFTKDYQQFCQRYLHGQFFHHTPGSHDDNNMTHEIYVTELDRYLSYVYDQLGEETLLKWFE